MVYIAYIATVYNPMDTYGNSHNSDSVGIY